MTKALSLTVFAERSNVTGVRTDGHTDGRTDGRTDRIGITIGDLMLRADALASIAKNQLLQRVYGASVEQRRPIA